jgi:hypothetical protein
LDRQTWPFHYEFIFWTLGYEHINADASERLFDSSDWPYRHSPWSSALTAVPKPKYTFYRASHEENVIIMQVYYLHHEAGIIHKHNRTISTNKCSTCNTDCAAALHHSWNLADMHSNPGPEGTI